MSNQTGTTTTGTGPKFTDHLHEVPLTNVTSLTPSTTTSPPITTPASQGFGQISQQLLQKIQQNNGGISLKQATTAASFNQDKGLQFSHCGDIACNVSVLDSMGKLGGSRYKSIPRLSQDSVLGLGPTNRHGIAGVGFGEQVGGFHYIVLEDTGKTGFQNAGKTQTSAKDALAAYITQAASGHAPKTSAATRGYAIPAFQAMTYNNNTQQSSASSSSFQHHPIVIVITLIGAIALAFLMKTKQAH